MQQSIIQGIAAILLALASFLLPASADEFEMEGAVAEVYKRIGDTTLRAFIFRPENHASVAHRPAVVFFFGGGWVSGSPKQFAPHCRHLAERGLVAITAEYRVKSRHGTTPFECVKDGKSAIRWARTHAGRLGIDPQRIAAAGGSAGGHVAAATGTILGLEEQTDDLKVSSRPNALILFNPVFDNGPDGGYGFDRVGNRYREISPRHNIRKGAPPTVVFFGTNDHLVSVETAKSYEARMTEVGSRCETHFYDGAGHGFFNKGRNNDEYFDATVKVMDDFLDSLGYNENRAKAGRRKSDTDLQGRN